VGTGVDGAAFRVMTGLWCGWMGLTVTDDCPDLWAEGAGLACKVERAAT